MPKKILRVSKDSNETINPEAAKKIREHLKKSFLLLQENPHIGHVTNDYDVFEWHVPRTKYSLPYMFDGDFLIILRIYDERQNRPGSWMD